jgi:hypothetical protein
MKMFINLISNEYKEHRLTYFLKKFHIDNIQLDIHEIHYHMFITASLEQRMI